MCTLLVWKRLHPHYPLIAAANRDEFFDRPSAGPDVLCEDPVVVGGRDLSAGGSWFAVSARGLFVAVTNRRDAGRHDRTKRSRGGLVVEIARSSSFSDARDRLRRIDASEFNPFILVVADAAEALAAHGGADGVRAEPIGDGPHAITNWDLDASAPAKAARARRIAADFQIFARENSTALAARIHAQLADHADHDEPGGALCVHKPERSYGTRSSSIVFLGAEPVHTRLYHAEGPPCTSSVADVSARLHDDSVARSKATT